MPLRANLTLAAQQKALTWLETMSIAPSGVVFYGLDMEGNES